MCEIEQRWLVESWHRLCWVCSCDWLGCTLAVGCSERNIYLCAWHAICHSLPLDRAWHKFVFFNGGFGRGRCGTSRGSCPTGNILVISSCSAMRARWTYGWTWTHLMYNDVYMPAHSLNSTWESSAMQYLASSPTCRWPCQSHGIVGFEYVLDLEKRERNRYFSSGQVRPRFSSMVIDWLFI